MSNRAWFLPGLLLIQGLCLIGMLVARYEHQHFWVMAILLLINMGCYACLSYTIYRLRRPSKRRDPIPSCGECTPTEKRTSK